MVSDSYGGLDGLYQYLRKCARRHEAYLGREDLVQEAFLAALRKEPPVNFDDSRARQWLARALQYAALKEHRDHQRRIKANSEELERQRARSGIGCEWCDLSDAIEQLPPSERKCLLLRTYRHSYDEIGEQLKITAKSARSIVYNARRRLRAMMEG